MLNGLISSSIRKLAIDGCLQRLTVLIIKLSKRIRKQQIAILATTTASLYPVMYSTPSSCKFLSIATLLGSSAGGLTPGAIALVLVSLKESVDGGSESTILITVVAQISEIQEVKS